MLSKTLQEMKELGWIVLDAKSCEEVRFHDENSVHVTKDSAKVIAVVLVATACGTVSM